MAESISAEVAADLAAEVQSESLSSASGSAGPASDYTGAGYRTTYVNVHNEHGEIVDVIAVENQSDKKYMGGYRDARTGLEYLHAYSQTPVERVSKWANMPPRFTRESQTTTTVTRSVQIKREGAAQTKRSDLHFDTSTDKEVVARPYFDAEQLLAVKHKASLAIQCQFRSFRARKQAADLLREREEAAAAMFAEEERAAQEAAEKHARDIERRMHPRSAEDFGVLYDEVEAWRTAETSRIHAEISDPAAQKDAFAALLAKEQALLGTIERLRAVANKENREKRISEFMSALAQPKAWSTSTGDVVVVDTPFVVRARELRDLFLGLSEARIGRDERLELLLHVKYTVKEFDCALTREIVGLIDRETDMLNRGRPESTVVALRQRLRNLFLMFCENPDFNPEAARFHKMPPRDARTTPSFLRPPQH
jgi:hypothetical protein